jgi:hypothetical protein
LQATQVFNITLARKKALGAFSLKTPANNTSLEVEEGNNTDVNITWGKSNNSALYRWFVTSATGTFTSPLLRINSNNSGQDSSLTLTSGTLDNVLNSLGVKRTESVSLKWTVYAYIDGDSLKAGQDWNITLTRKRVLSAFNLTAPANNARVEVAKNNNTPIVITWSASNKVGAYRWKATVPAGNFSTPLLNLASDNGGKDNKLTLTSGAVDAILKANGLKVRDSITLKWTVFAIETTDSVQAAETFNITLVRGRILGNFNLTAPANNATVAVDSNNNTPINISWSASANATQYKWLAIAAGGNFNTPLLNLTADNNGTGTTLSLTSGAVDAVLAAQGVKDGDSITLSWTVRAIEAEDSILASQTFSIKLIRTKNVGLRKYDISNKVSIYPNPTTDFINIATTDLTGEGQIVLTDLTGRILVNKKATFGSTTHQISVDGLSKGLYIIYVNTNQGSANYKITVE